MSDTVIAVPPQSAQSRAATGRGLIPLALALTLVLAGRAGLYAWMPERTSDFDLLYQMAARLIAGEDPYGLPTSMLPYPLPAVLLAIPFTLIPLALARPIFDVLVGWAFAYALWRYRGAYALLAVASGAYVFAMLSGQTTPLMVAASLIPALGFLLAVKPNSSAALWMARPSWTAIFGVAAFVALSFVVLPSWPRDWWRALPPDTSALVPPILRPYGFVLLLAALRWRSPEGRLILAIPFIPQTTLPYELVSLALIPATRLEMGIFLAGSWIVVGAADQLHLGQGMADWMATGWPVTLCAVYLPTLFMVLRRQRGWSGPTIEPKFGKDRRRPYRLPDEELEVDSAASDEGGAIVTVTHLPSRLSATESGRTRQEAERKAQDRLAAIVAEHRRRKKRA
jgi:hypothetical protein